MILTAAVLSVALSLLFLRLLTRRLGVLEDAIRRFRDANGIATPVPHETGSSPGGDEVDRLEALFGDLADGHIETRKRLYGDGFMVDDSFWRGRAVGMPFGLQGRDRPLEFRLLHVVEFDDGGDISRENVWLDLAAIMRQLPQD